MKTLRSSILGQRGIVLAGSLMILSALVVAGVAARVMLRNDHRTSANLRGGSEVFYLSASGIEWGKNEILSSTGLTPAPADRSVTFNQGRFSVSFVSALDLGPLSAQFVVRSLGIQRGDSHALQARLTKTYDLGDSALGLRGNIQGASFGGVSIAISGIDQDPVTGQPNGGSGRPAVSSDSQALLDLVTAQTASLPAGSLQAETSGPAVALTSHLSPTILSQLADRLCAAPGAVTLAVPASGTLALADQSWGTAKTPQLRCFDGSSAVGDGVTLAGESNGAGILIVRNADLIVSGTFRWEGLILITGSEVSLKTGPSSVVNVFGSMIINETGNPSPSAAAVDIQGSFRASFSRAALNRGGGLIPSAELDWFHAALPASIRQDYWRSVSP